MEDKSLQVVISNLCSPHFCPHAHHFCQKCSYFLTPLLQWYTSLIQLSRHNQAILIILVVWLYFIYVLFIQDISVFVSCITWNVLISLRIKSLALYIIILALAFIYFTISHPTKVFIMTDVMLYIIRQYKFISFVVLLPYCLLT